MSIEVDNHPTASLDALVPCLRKVVKGFCDNGDYWLILHFYNGGLRAPRISDAGDKQKVKKALIEFLRVWGKPRYTGQIAFYLKHGEFKEYFNVYPGSGSFDEYQKEGIKFKVTSFTQDYNDDRCLYRIDEIEEIAKKSASAAGREGVIQTPPAEEDVPF
jgi:hypothetical protein